MVETDVMQWLLAADDGGRVDLGSMTADEMRDAVRNHADGPDAADLFIALVRHARTELALPAAVEIVRQSWDPGTMAEIASWLGRGGEVPAGSRRALGQAFLDRSQDRAAHHGVRAHALKGAMILAQSERALLRLLQAELIDLDPTDDGDYLRHAARIAGAVLAHEPDDDLRSVLEKLSTVDDAADEAAMELGLDALRGGLDSTQHDQAVQAFESALRWFERAEAAGEARPDAQLYRRSVDMLVAFQSDRTADDIRGRIDGIRAAAFQYTAYLTSSDRSDDTFSWLGLKNRERVHWSMLGMRLGALDVSFLKQAWLRAAEVIEDELLAVYTASRSILKRNEGGLEEVLRPRVVGALQRDRHSLVILDQWIEENAGSGCMTDAENLRAEVAEARGKLASHRPSEAAPGSSPVAAILEQIPEPGRSSAMARIEANVLALASETTSKIVDDAFAAIVDGLQRNVDYRDRPEAKEFFDIVLLYGVKYLVARYNLSKASMPRVAFLFNRDKAKPPLEKHLQEDFHDFLMGSPFAEICRAEPRDLGGGRGDILFTRGWLKTTAELKRSFAKRTPSELVDELGLQAMSYQGTNITCSLLMVLDLFDRDGGQPNVREQFSLHHRKPNWGETEYSIVLLRIQGRRHTPSDL
jgi:hypothetical protein